MSHVFLLVKPKPDLYGRSTKEEKLEFFDDETEFAKKIDDLAKLIKNSEHCIVFTGAGISTSCGIPDFRSGLNTVLEIGPGVWELKDHGITRSKKTKETLKAIPSYTHMSIVKLQEEGYLKFVVSQNTDGLHLRSGLNSKYLAELHGNTNLEYCKKCKAKYLRDFRTRNAKREHDHFTGRICAEEKCKGKLYDSIINFGENLPENDWNQAVLNAKMADLCICLGSSLTVSPANEIPKMVKKSSGKLVICNLQQTPLHYKCDLPIYGFCDDVMKGLAKRLDITVEKWKLRRRVQISMNPLKSFIRIVGLDITRDLSYSLFEQVKIFKTSIEDGVAYEAGSPIKTFKKEPFQAVLDFSKFKHQSLVFELAFHGHYREIPAVVKVKCPSKEYDQMFLLSYDVENRHWSY